MTGALRTRWMMKVRHGKARTKGGVAESPWGSSVVGSVDVFGGRSGRAAAALRGSTTVKSRIVGLSTRLWYEMFVGVPRGIDGV